MDRADTPQNKPPHSLLATTAWLLALSPAMAWADPAATALPSEATISHGSATTVINGSTMTVNQASQLLINNRLNYNIGSAASVLYKQPNISSIAVERMLGGTASQIFGSLQATGKVFLINPSGIVFGKGHSVNVGGIAASTANISDQNLISGNYAFSNPSNASIVQQSGQINASEGGLVSFIARNIDAQGTIETPKGDVVFAAGQAVNLNLTDSGLVSVAVDGEVAQAQIDQSGAIVADGGRVWMTARGAAGALKSAINMKGLVQANTINTQTGEIKIDSGSGDIHVNGTLQASGIKSSFLDSKGGQVSLTGANVELNQGTVDVRGSTFSSGGKLSISANELRLIDSTVLASGGSFQGHGGHVDVQADRMGMVNSKIDVSGGSFQGRGGKVVLNLKGLGLLASSTIDADGGAHQGSGGQVSLTANSALVSGVSIKAQGGSHQGSGGNITISAADTFLSQSRLYTKGGSFNGEGGQISVSGHDNLNISHSTLSSQGGGKGGQVELQGQNIALLKSTVDASAGNGQILSYQSLQAGEYGEQGGDIRVTAEQSLAVESSTLNVQGGGAAGSGGTLTLTGGDVSLNEAQLVAAGGSKHGDGGKTIITGDDVSIKASKVDVSGGSGRGKGGELYIGGGWQGKDPAIKEADSVIVSDDTQLLAEGGDEGEGGTLVLWSGGLTKVTDSTLSVESAGQGGKAETSGHYLQMDGSNTLKAGVGGQWLFDPYNLIVSSTQTDTNVTDDGSGGYTANASGAYVQSTSIETLLNAGTSVTLSTNGGGSEAGNITINADIAKTSGDDATLTFAADNNVTLSSGYAISSTTGKLNVTFGSVSLTSGTATLEGSISTNGGDVVFYKASELAYATPITTSYIASNTNASGAITFHKDVSLKASGYSVTLATSGYLNGAVYEGAGGAIDFKGAVTSGAPSGTIIPQALTLQTSGTTAGSVTFRDDLGTAAAPLGVLTFTGPSKVSFATDSADSSEGDLIYLKGTSGTMITASNTTGSNTRLEFDSTNFYITIVGGTIGGTTGTASYTQDSFDLGVADDNDGTARNLYITAHRSIAISNYSIDGTTNASSTKLNIYMDTYDTSLDSTIKGGSIRLDTATITTNGGTIDLGDTGRTGTASNFATGDPDDTSGTYGVEITNSTITTSGGNITVSGLAPTDGTGGAGVWIYNGSTLSAGDGNIAINGSVTAASTSDNKDGVIIGEGSNNRVTLSTTSTGSITITGDVSSVTAATSGNRYGGVVVSQNALIQTVGGDIAITGTGGSAYNDDDSYIGDENYGIYMETNGTSIISETGNITLKGKSGGKDGSYGIETAGYLMYIGQSQEAGNTSTYSGIVTLISDDMLFTNDSTSRLQIETTGEVRINPYSTATNIELGTTTGHTSLYLKSTYFSGSYNVFDEGTTDITIGKQDASSTALTGTLTVASATTVRDSLNLVMTGTGGNVVMTGALTVAGSSENRVLAINTQNGATGAGTVTVDKLHLLGSGAYTLTGSNAINTMSADFTGGELYLVNSQALDVGTVASTSYGTTTTDNGITQDNQNATIKLSSGNLTISQNVNVGTGIVGLIAESGTIADSGTAVITADQLGLNTSGSVTLDNGHVVVNIGGTVGTTSSGADLTYVSTTGINFDKITDGQSNVYTGLTVDDASYLTATSGTIVQDETNSALYSATSTSMTATGNIDLGLSTNAVGSMGATTTGGYIWLQNSKALTVTTVGSETGLTATTGVTLHTSNGDITIAQNITSNGDVVSLDSDSGAVNETGTAIVTADKLMVQATSNSTMANSNVVDEFAANVSADLTYNASAAIIFDTVSDTESVTLEGVTVTGSAFITAEAGSITQTANMEAVVGSLYLKTTGGGITLTDATNDITTLAVETATSGSAVEIVDADGVEIGTVTVSSVSKTGVTTTNGNFTLTATEDTGDGGHISLTQLVSLGTGTGILITNDGAVTDTGSGQVTLQSLYIKAADSSALDNTANDVDNLAAILTGTSSSFTFADIDDLTITTVNSQAGITTVQGDVQITASADDSSTAGNLTIDANTTITTNNSGTKANITLKSLLGSVVENATSSLVGSGLQVYAKSNTNLNIGSHDIDTLAVNMTDTSAQFTYTQAQNLSIGTVNGVSGITTNGGNVNVVLSTGSLTLDQSVTTGYSSGDASGAVVFLDTTGSGSITESSGVTITSYQLIARANTGITLYQSNQTNQLAAYVSNGTLTYKDTDSVTVTSISVSEWNSGTSSFDSNSYSGLDTSAANKEQHVEVSSGTLTLAQNVSAGTGTVSMDVGGAITQTGGAVTAGKLRMRANGTIKVAQSSNDVDDLSALITGSTGTVYFVDTDDVNITSITGTLGSNNVTTAGIDSSGSDGEAYIKSGGAMTMDQALTTGAGIMTLDAGGSITQNSGSTVTASSLQVKASGNVSLLEANDVDTLSASALGTFSFEDSDDLALGSVTSTLLASTTAGVDTSASNSDIYIKNTTSTLSMSQNVSAGTGRATFQSASTITQSANAVTAGSLQMIAGATITMVQSGNDVDNLAVSISGTGTLAYVDSDNLAIEDVNRTIDGATLDTDGITTASGEILIKNTSGTLTLGDNVSGSGQIVSLDSGGAITQSDGVVTATSLRIRAGGAATLSRSNVISTLAAESSSGSFTFNNSTAFTVGTITGTLRNADSSNVVTTTGLSTTNSDATLSSEAGIITLSQAVTAGSGTISVTGDDGIQSTVAISGATIGLTATSGDIVHSTGAITGTTALTLAAASDITLTSSTVTAPTMSMTTTTGDITLTSSPLTATTSLTMSAGSDISMTSSDATAGLISMTATSNHITLSDSDLTASTSTFGMTAGEDISLSSDSNLGAATTLTMTAGSDVILTGSSDLTAATLNMTATSDNISITSSDITVTTMDMTATAGSITQDTGTLSGTTLSLTATAGAITQTTGTMTATNALSLTAGTDITQTDGTMTGTTSLSMTAASDITQTDGTISGGTLSLTATSDNIVQSAGTISGTTITVNAGTGLTQNGGSVTGTTVSLTGGSGGITQSSGTITATTLGLTAGSSGISQTGGSVTSTGLLITTGGNVSMKQTGNDVDTLAASSTSGTLYFRDTDDVTVGTVSGTSGLNATDLIWLRAGGNLTISSGHEVLSSGSGSYAVVLVSGAAFTNSDDSDGIQTANSRWMVYDLNPSFEDRFNGLTYSNLRLETLYDNYTENQVLETGNVYLTNTAAFNTEGYTPPLVGSEPPPNVNSVGTLPTLGGGTGTETNEMTPDSAYDTDVAPQEPFGLATDEPGGDAPNTGGTVTAAAPAATPSVVPLDVELPAGRRFDIDLEDYVGENGVVDEIDVEGGALPEWLTYDAETATMSGTAPMDMAEPLTISLKVKGPGGVDRGVVTMTINPGDPIGQ
ncbi:two-partner secretion domain-containing protein [Magnetococcus sp. PR-3]|uniref:two-partner secretion domain-containing protein n=1 Tax=Magnetococcus sp. PR-3 TaxID=3120355 RepID=UPI002FCE0685